MRPLQPVVCSFSVFDKSTLKKNLLKNTICYDNRYRVILKKVSFGIFRTILVSKAEKIFTIKRAISEQVFMIFGHGQNHQN